MKLRIIASLLIAGGIVSPMAHATNGYFPIAYGMKNEGMGGASIALPQDALAAANNPAGMVMVGDRTDIGLILFMPHRKASVNGNDCSAGVLGPYACGGGTLNGEFDGNGKSDFFIPQFGYNKMINANTSVGVSVFGNGGMNTQYNTNPLAPFGASGQMGINLEQLFIAPTWSMKYNDTSAVGIALNLAYQRFSATGLQPFDCLTSFGACPDGIGGFTTNPAYSPTASPGSVTNNGTDTSTGYGLRLGWTGEVQPGMTLGATYQTKTKMGKFTKYQGLFADQGSFDIPSKYGLGIAYKIKPETTVAFDIERINYSDVPSVHDSGSVAQQLGSNGGPGFGWQNLTVYKLGVSHAYSTKFTVRAGYDHSDQPIPSKETFFNILAPGIVQDHLTLGGTWKLENNREVTVAYVHAFNKKVSGSGSISPSFGGGEVNLNMYEDSIGISYGW
ncbi:MAG: outer membrane protein transport protein [Nitrosomonadales bacterium]|nr:outer membrane protein transport protein [Nitrosomonadales bacterium]